MNTHTFRLALLATLPLASALLAQPPTPVPEKPDANGWIQLFDGQTLSGWSTADPGDWTITGTGTLVGRGKTSHLFSPNTYTNLEFKAEVRLNHKGNSGMYFRAAFGKGWPKGYETQVENTSSDPQRTGSLYNLSKVTEQLVPDDTWWTQHVIAIGNRTVIKVNGKIVTDFIDDKHTYKSGHLALQQHDPGSVVEYRNVQVRRLPADPAEALALAAKDTPGLKP